MILCYVPIISLNRHNKKYDIALIHTQALSLFGVIKAILLLLLLFFMYQFLFNYVYARTYCTMHYL